MCCPKSISKSCLAKQNTLLTLIGESLIRLSQADDIKLAIRVSIEKIGEQTEMEAIRLYEVEGELGEEILRLTYEWIAGAGMSDFTPLAFPLNDSPTRRGVAFITKIGQDSIIKVPASLKDKARYALACPIYVGGGYWGLMVFFSCSEDREWVNDRLSTFNLMAVGVGSLVAMRAEMTQLKIVNHYALEALNLIVKSEKASVALRRKYFEDDEDDKTS
jgi:hypothetical protein